MFTRRHWHATVALVTLASSIALTGAGCSTTPKETFTTHTSALSSNAGEVLGFEKAADWHVTSGQAITLTSNTTHTQGAASLAVPARGYVTVQSTAFSISSPLPGTISFDLSLPPPVSPSWAGATQLYVDCHSHGIFNQFIGQQELTGQPSGQFTTESFTVPSAVVGALPGGCGDLSFTIALNVPIDATGTYLLDNLQLGGPPTAGTCSTTPGSFGDGGLTGSKVSFSNQLTRPDLGTLVLSTTAVQGDPFTVTRSITLNGNPLYSMQSQQSGTGSATMSITVSPPITGVHQLVATSSDGQTVTFVVDGRQTQPVPSAPTSLTFVDGRPAPVVSAPTGLQDAISQLLTSAGQQAETCLAGSGSGTELLSLLASTGNDNGHNSTVSGKDCNLCEAKCYGLELLCAAAAPAIFNCSILPSLFGFFGTLVCTAVVDVTACTKFMFDCERDCHAAGSQCCPVDCGGAGDIITPIGLCCVSGESCLKRGNDDHVGICCSPGKTPCGGVCCGSDNVCAGSVPNGPHTFCCLPSQIGPLGNCCVNGGPCKTNAECPGSACGADGCCTNG